MRRVVAVLACVTATACAAGSSGPNGARTPDDCGLVGKAAVAYSDIRQGLADGTVTQQDAADQLDTVAGYLRDVATIDAGARARTAHRGAVAAGRLRVMVLAATDAGMSAEVHALGRAVDSLSRTCL